MWRLPAFVALLSLAGCFAPSAPTGARCAPAASGARCPLDQLCIAHDGVETCELPGTAYPDAAIDPEADAPANLDRDNDGVRNADDNCPDIANLDQIDEDGDHVGDACDPCPPLPNNSDGDGDGVGDACDPNPATPGDKLVAFEGFTSPLSAGWTHTGAFKQDGGTATLFADDSATALLAMASPLSPRVEIRASLGIDLITANGLNLGSVNLIERMQPNTDKSIACQLSGLANGTQEELRIFDANASAVVVDAPHALSLTTPFELRLRRNGTSYGCRATNPTAEVSGTAAFSPGSPRIGLRVRGAVATFHWVMIVTSP